MWRLSAVSCTKLSRGSASTTASTTILRCANAADFPLFTTRRYKSSNGGTSDKEKKKPHFRPRRKPDENYRPFQADTKLMAKKKKNQKPMIELDKPPVIDHSKANDSFYVLDKEYGPKFADHVRDYHRKKVLQETGVDENEDNMRLMDYLTAPIGSLEDLTGERRAKMPMYSTPMDDELDEEEARMHDVRMIEDVQNDWFETKENATELDSAKVEMDKLLDTLRNNFGRVYNSDGDGWARIDPNQKVHGNWGEHLVHVSRTTKLWRGGRLESYRALVIGGNYRGCGGFGIGKSNEPNFAVEAASRLCKKNIFFVDRYQGDGLTHDLAGKQNSCKVSIRATDLGLAGNELMREILKYFGITHGRCKAYGNRNPYNVVRATFKALMTHESLEEISMKRGKRLISLDRAKRLQV